MDTNIINIASLMIVVCIKQHQSNIWSSIYEKVKQHWGWVVNELYLITKKYCAIKVYPKCHSILLIDWKSRKGF